MSVITLQDTDFTAGAHYRTTFECAAGALVYVDIANSAMRDCVHHFESPNRFGDAECGKCAAQAWSLRWVAKDVFGPETPEWSARQTGQWRRRSQESGVVVIDFEERRILRDMVAEQEADDARLLEEEWTKVTSTPSVEPEPLFAQVARILGPMPTPKVDPPSEVVAADLNPDAPARNRRSGFLVPRMTPIGADWTPEGPR